MKTHNSNYMNAVNEELLRLEGSTAQRIEETTASRIEGASSPILKTELFTY